MLTNNKAVYGTDGTLKTLKDMGGNSPSPTPEPIVLDGEETTVIDDGIESTLNNYVVTKTLDTIKLLTYFEHGIYSSAGQSLGEGLTRLLISGANRPIVYMSLMDNSKNFDFKAIPWDFFSTIFKVDTESLDPKKIVFYLPNNSGVLKPVNVFGAGKDSNNRYMIKYSCDDTDITSRVLLMEIDI